MAWCSVEAPSHGSVSRSLLDVTVGVNSPVAEKRPVRALGLERVEIGLDDEDFLLGGGGTA